MFHGHIGINALFELIMFFLGTILMIWGIADFWLVKENGHSDPFEVLMIKKSAGQWNLVG